MKKIIVLFFCLVATFWSGAQTPQKDTLRILAVGNSFSNDGTELLPALLEAAGVHNVILGRLYIGGCSLERHCREYEDSGHNYSYYKSTGNKWEELKHCSIKYGLKDDKWDIVTIQQVSGQSGQFETVGKYGDKLIGIIRKECSGSNPEIVWHQTWAYADNSEHPDFPSYGSDQKTMYDAICDCTAKVKEAFRISRTVPCGTAIQYARQTRVNNKGKVPPTSRVYDLTRDGYHLSLQFGQYVAACTWFEALISPFIGQSVLGNPCLLLDTNSSIDEKDAWICQMCAVQAVKDSQK